jgi:hypothetical protein
MFGASTMPYTKAQLVCFVYQARVSGMVKVYDHGHRSSARQGERG